MLLVFPSFYSASFSVVYEAGLILIYPVIFSFSLFRLFGKSKSEGWGCVSICWFTPQITAMVRKLGRPKAGVRSFTWVAHIGAGIFYCFPQGVGRELAGTQAEHLGLHASTHRERQHCRQQLQQVPHHSSLTSFLLSYQVSNIAEHQSEARAAGAVRGRGILKEPTPWGTSFYSGQTLTFFITLHQKSRGHSAHTALPIKVPCSCS